MTEQINNSHASPREWRVYYSKAKQREYYYDPISQESTWVLPANASRLTDYRDEKEEVLSIFRKLILLAIILVCGIWLSSNTNHTTAVVTDNSQSSSSEPRIKLPETENDSSKSPELLLESIPSSWKKVLEKEIPHDAELDQLTKNIEAALQSSEDLLKKIVADAKEAGMEIKASSFTNV
ncbi:hypothetical protein FisN_14Hh070 [Fistulifera solaris]|jgi:hypothetical protein|uniref:WW domain-containing protein n=1 Tax=Fistulifera solaris TaxID=1519565 RepID=A0A1Z5K8H1_FISSO|nr:hypothetical protein FisN_14Hh070 [Fistulifera solaris]|eukprot:GAX22455.1 hypothetical protein FisN_14Hh070 [Fistulifera solaris]